MIIYITTNLINGKKYIGKDSKNNPNYLGSNKQLREDIKKYGKNNFTKHILEYCTSIVELNSREIVWLRLYNCKDSSNFYNLTDTVTPCRVGVPHTKEHRERIARAHIGKKMPPQSKEAIEKRKLTKKINGNDRHSQSTKEKISLALRGKKKSIEHRKALSVAKKGKKTRPCPESVKNKISEKQNRRTIGKVNPSTGLVEKVYHSISSVKKDGYNPHAVQAVLSGKSKKSGGSFWFYL